LVAGLTVAVQAETYKIDRSHSSVGFSVTHLGLSKVKGSFGQFSGNVVSKSAVDVTIDATSINTHSEGRDKHLKSGDFFAADSFPTITFKSVSVTPKGPKNFDVTGDLTLRGVTKPVTLAVELVGTMDDANMGKRAGFTASGTINRQDFGVNWNNTLDAGGLVVSNDVDILLEIETVVPKEKPAN
jgi:polyisoprenoid-binding protein YceI